MHSTLRGVKNGCNQSIQTLAEIICVAYKIKTVMENFLFSTHYRPVKSPKFGGWHQCLTLISSTPVSIDVSSRISMILPYWSRFWFVFSVKITHPSFPTKSYVVWLLLTLFVHLCMCLMMGWIARYLGRRSLVWHHCQVAIHWGQLYIAWFLPFLIWKCKYFE